MGTGDIVVMTNNLCAGIYCDGICVETFLDDDVCLSKSIAYFCVGSHSNIFTLWLSLSLIVLLFYFLTYLFSDLRPKTCTLVMGLLNNAFFTGVTTGVVCLFAGFGPLYLSFLMPSIFFLIFSNIPILLTEEGNETNGNNEDSCCMMHIMEAPIFYKNEAQQIINMAYSNPPIIELLGTINYVSQVQFMQNSQLRTISSASLIPFKDYVHYKTWTTNEVTIDQIPDETYSLVQIKNKFRYSEGLENEIRQKESEMIQRGRSIGGDTTVYRNSTVNDSMKQFLATNSQSKPLFYQFINSCCGQTTYYISFICGLQTVIESIFCFGVRTRKIKVIRYLSDNEEYPNAAYQPNHKYSGGQAILPPQPIAPNLFGQMPSVGFPNGYPQPMNNFNQNPQYYQNSQANNFQSPSPSFQPSIPSNSPYTPSYPPPPQGSFPSPQPLSTPSLPNPVPFQPMIPQTPTIDPTHPSISIESKV